MDDRIADDISHAYQDGYNEGYKKGWAEAEAYLLHCGDETPVTNADRIRAMTDEELAKFIDEAEPDCYMRYEDEDGYSTCKSRNCVECWLIWLKQEAWQ